MGQVKAPDVPRPERGMTDFERKIADILFAETSTNEMQVERVLDVAIAISDGLTKDVDGIVNALINKGCNFIRERLRFDDNAWYTNGELTLKDKVIEEFKKYMKGEKL